MNLGNVIPWDVGDTEIAYYAKKGGGSSRGSLPLFIPKLQTLHSNTMAPQPPYSLSITCYANATACKPAVASKINLQTFITVPIQSNRYFRNPYFQAGAKMYVEIHNKNVDTMYISTKLDNSVV